MAIDTEQNNRAKDELVKTLGHRGTFALTGAGLSRWAGYRLWGEVLTRLAARVREHRGDEINVESIFQKTTNKLQLAAKLCHELSDGPFAEFMDSEFGPPSRPVDPVVSTVLRLPFRHFLTLNFDVSLERISQPALRTLTTADPARLWPFLQEHTHHDRSVIHLHGCYRDPRNRIALAEEVYRELYNNKLETFLWPIMATQQVVFLGCGFQDLDFNTVLHKFQRFLSGDTRHFHYAVVGLNPGEDGAERRVAFKGDYLINPIFYEVTIENEIQNHSGFPILINELATALGIELSPVPRTEGLQNNAPDQNNIRHAEELQARLLQRADSEADE